MKNGLIRPLWLVAFLVSTGLIGYSYYLELYDALLPCPLCSLQRYTLLMLTPFFLLGVLIGKYRRILHGLIALVTTTLSSLGIWFAGRQTWLQWQPQGDSQVGCGVSLHYLMKILPFDKALKQAISGTPECSAVPFTLLHLSLAEWSLIVFVAFLVLSLAQVVRALRSG